MDRFSWADPEGGDRGSGPTGKSQVAIDFFRNTGMDPPQGAIGPLGLFWGFVRPSLEVSTTLCKIC